MSRPDLSVLPIATAIVILSQWAQPHIPVKLVHAHEKISDAELIAVAILQKLHKVP